MNHEEFEKHREAFRKLMAEKSLAEIRAARSTFEKMHQMFPYQILYLINDLKLLESYKSKSNSVNEEFERVMKGYFG